MSQLVLQAAASAVLDAAGNGTALLGPTLPGTSWQPQTIAVQCSGNVTEAQCNILVGLSPQAAQLLAATATGSTGDSTDCTVTVWPGQVIIAAWTGGDPGATATVSVFGLKTVPGA